MKVKIVHDGFALVPESWADKLKIARIQKLKYPGCMQAFRVRDISFAVESFQGRGFYVYHGREKVH